MDNALLNRGTAVTWSGVVQIERPKYPSSDALCRVYSARNIEWDGKRAIYTQLPYSAVSCYFQSGDEDIVQVAASLRDECLQLHERCNFKEWAHFSGHFN